MYFHPKPPTESETFELDRATYAAIFALQFNLNFGNGMYWGEPLNVPYGDGVKHVFVLRQE